MTASISNTKPSFGFITVVELPQLGFCGGLLIVSHIGRPIEFHCTTPVATNRTQEIMYGQTYTGFLYADQIGKSLVDKTNHVPSVFVTDCPDLLPISELVDAPIVLVENSEQTEPFDGRGLKQFPIQNSKDRTDQTVFCVNVGAEDIEVVQNQMVAFANRLPIDEPFERIRFAIKEAHPVARSA